MTAFFATLFLAVVVFGWFGLALLPALLELRHRTDVEPLQLRRGGGDVRHFALSFQRFVDAELAALDVDGVGPAPVDSVTARGGAVALRDGQPAWRIPPANGPTELSPESMPKGALASHVVLSESALVVPDHCSLFKELYVAQDLEGGADCSYRAVMGLSDVSLGARSDVLRWIDSGGRLVAGEDSVLYGRASASVGMWLLDGVRFQRVAAPTITFGSIARGGMVERTYDERPDDSPLEDAREVVPHARQSVMMGTRPPLEPPAGVTESWGRWLIEGDFTVPDGEYVLTDLVVTGVLRVGKGCRVLGAVKSAVLIGGDASIFGGAIVATSRLELGAGSIVAGPVVVEGEAVLGAGSHVGTLADPTTISAVSVRVGRWSTVCGEVWCRGWGEVQGAASG